MRKVIKEFISLFGPLALAICLSAAWFVQTRNDNNLSAIQRQQYNVVTLETQIITREIASHTSDTRFLARLVGRKLAPSHNGPLRQLEDDFQDFARSRPYYSQLRFIDASGMERIRVDTPLSGPTALPQSAMQDKSDRYYFRETLRASRDAVYISHFDLNVELGMIELPHKPTLRFACPVFDDSDTLRGVVVLNYKGSHLLDQVRSHATSGGGTIMFTTGDGHWMLGPSPDDAWGHVLRERKSATMGQRFPVAWAAIQKNETGQILTPRGLFTYGTIEIIPGATLSRSRPTQQQLTRRWKVVSLVEPSQLDVPWMNLFIVLACLLIVMLSVGCWFLARYRVRQSEVEAELRDSEERTLAISQSSQDAIVMIDEDDRISYWNPAAERMFGHLAEKVLDKRLHAILSPPDAPPLEQKGIEQFAVNEKGNTAGRVMEMEVLHKNGFLVPVELAISSFSLKGRWYAVGSMRDITRRKRDQEELLRRNEINKALINAPTDSALLIDPDGTLVAINKVASERAGIDPEAVIGKSVYDFIPQELVPTRKAKVAQVVETGEPVQFEDSVKENRLQNNLYPCKNPDGSVDRIAIFARDITDQHRAKQDLMASEQRFRDVSESVGEFIWETDDQGNIQFLTADVESVIGYSVSDMTGQQPRDFIEKDETDAFSAWRDAMVSKREPFSNVQFQCRTKKGETIWLQASGVPYFDSNGVFQGYRGAAMDITDSKHAEDTIKDSEQKLRALAESAYDAIIMIDTNGTVSFWNDAASELFGYSEEEALGQDVHTLITPAEMRDHAHKGMYQFALTGKGPAVGKIEETIGLHKDGTEIPVERSVAGFQLGGEWYAVATIRDITQRKETEATLTRLATTDSLTGLNNRRRFMELAETEFARSLRYGRPLSLIMLDIDHFKNVNDTFGHDVGDDVLRALAETAILALRNADILGRLGGEEFGVILPETGKNSAMDVAERLRTSVERSIIATNAGEINITISLGVACLDQDTLSPHEMLKRADVALYKAKQSGRNKTVLGGGCGK